jgi:hypothetical protein
LPRARSGQSSATIEAPVAHSEPMAMPTMSRSTANDSQFHANAERPVISEYARIAYIMVRLRPM